LGAPQAVYSLPDPPPKKTTTTKNIKSDETAAFPTEIVLAAACWSGCLHFGAACEIISAQMIINVPIGKFY